MQTVHSVAELRALLADERRAALVPTMGNLHRGHLQLIRRARQLGGPVVASIFVNRLQFGAGEDFDRYPRTLAEDACALAEAGCDILFAPDEVTVYPTPQTVLVQPPLEAEQLCGLHRPGHFAGVLTLVCKLFNAVQPAAAVFGEKDFQQLWLIREMVRQLAVPVQIIGQPTERDADGLALSSRNTYLSATERREAVRLYRTLCDVRARIEGGHWEVAAVLSGARRDLEANGWGVEYIEVRDAATLRPPQAESREWVLMAAAHLGTTRLIDNVRFARVGAA